MRKKALLMVLSAKAQKGLLIVLNDFGATKISAKEMSLILNNLPCKDGSVLVALPKMDKNLILSIRNLWQVETSQAKDLNALDLLSFKYLLMPQESVKVIEKTFGK